MASTYQVGPLGPYTVGLGHRAMEKHRLQSNREQGWEIGWGRGGRVWGAVVKSSWSLTEGETKLNQAMSWVPSQYVKGRPLSSAILPTLHSRAFQAVLGTWEDRGPAFSPGFPLWTPVPSPEKFLCVSYGNIHMKRFCSSIIVTRLKVYVKKDPLHNTIKTTYLGLVLRKNGKLIWRKS